MATYKRINGDYYIQPTSNVVIAGSILTSGQVSATGNLITDGILTVNSGNIAGTVINNAGGNGVGNIGSSSSYFNTLFATTSMAINADLAEHYEADADYAPGTVLIFGGDKEVTVTETRADARVAGAVSTDPAYLMNSESIGVPLALRGRIPLQVIGPVTKGDSLITSTESGYAESVGQDVSYGQAVFAKALETNLDPGKKIITAVIL